MSTRLVRINLKRLTNAPWAAGARVVFKLVKGTFTASNTYPEDRLTVQTDAGGIAEAELWCNSEALKPVQYICELPTNERFGFVLPAGDTPVQLEALRAAGAVPAAPTNQQILSAIVDAHADRIATVAELGHFRPDGVTLVVDTSSGIASVIGDEGVSDHGELTGLDDNDHPQYQLRSERNTSNGYCGLDSSGLVPDIRLPASIARDTELSGAISAHVAEPDPHVQYLRQVEGDALYAAVAHLHLIADVTGLQTSLDAKLPLAGGTLTGALALAADPTLALHAATKSYVDQRVASLIDSSPGALDTLNELAAALGDDPNFATTITNLVGEKASKAANLSDLASPASARTNLGLGTAATLNVSAFAPASHTHVKADITDLTNATTGEAGLMSTTQVTKLEGIDTGATANSPDATLLARANHTGTQLASTISDFNAVVDTRIAGAVGVSVQAYDADLSVIAALVPIDNDIIQRKSGGWANRTIAQFKADLSLSKSDVGLGNIDNTSDANKPVSTAQQTALNLKANLTSNVWTGHQTFLPDNTYDIGASGATRPRNLYIGGDYRGQNIRLAGALFTSGSPSRIGLGTNSSITWNNNTDGSGSGDTSLVRPKASVIGIGNGESETNGGTFRTKATTASQLTANQDNYNPGGVSYFQRWSSDASRNVTGLSIAQVDGEVHTIINVGVNNIVLVNESVSSSAANRFTNSTGADITLSAKQAADFIYDGSTSRWLVFKRN